MYRGEGTAPNRRLWALAREHSIRGWDIFSVGVPMNVPLPVRKQIQAWRAAHYSWLGSGAGRTHSLK